MRDVIGLEELKVFWRKDIHTAKFSDEIQFQPKNIAKFPERIKVAKPSESPKVAKTSKSRTKPKAKMVTYADKFLKTNKHESEIDELNSKTQKRLTDKIFRIIELLVNMIKLY